jgi:hypothetical protein
MAYHQFICAKHYAWIEQHPCAAFERVKNMSRHAQALLAKQSYDEALPYLGTVFETLEALFDLRVESPQLTNELTSSAIMLAQAYSQLNAPLKANEILLRLYNKLQGALAAEQHYASKMVFYRHCANSLLQAKDEVCSSLNEAYTEASKQSQEFPVYSSVLH